jgi:hypothetical protein
MAQKSDMYGQITDVNELFACLDSDATMVPTVEFTVRNFELPFSDDDIGFFEQPEINLFATSQQVSRGADNKYARSYNLTDQTLTFDQPFVLMGICVYAYGDGENMLVEGNQFGPQAVVDGAGGLPASPMNLRNIPLALAALWPSGQQPAGAEYCPSQLAWGNPTQQIVWAFLHAYRLQMRCPTSSYEILMDEALADIGNCCSQVEWNGVGSAKMAYIDKVRTVNERLKLLGQLPDGSDPGYFLPINADQDEFGAIHPNRLYGDLGNYVAARSLPAVEQWYRLPFPMPFPAVPQPKIKITFKKADGDQGYNARVLTEGTMDKCLSPIPSGACKFPINEGDPLVRTADGGLGCMTRIPAGRMRIGVGLKGFEVRQSVCDDLACMVSGKSYSQIKSDPNLRGLVGRSGIVSSQVQLPPGMVQVPAGSVGEPRR